MSTIKLKNSTVLDKAPTAGDLEIGELAINANVGSPGAYIKDTDDNIIKIAGSGVGETPDLQAVLETGHVTYGESIQLNQAQAGGSPFPTLQVVGSSEDTSGSVFVRGGAISVESDINDAFEVGNYLGNGNYDWNFKCDHIQASFAKPLTITKQLIGPQGTGSAGGTEINLDAETGKVTLYDTSPIGGTPKTILWQFDNLGSLLCQSATLEEHLTVEETATVEGLLTLNGSARMDTNQSFHFGPDGDDAIRIATYNGSGNPGPNKNSFYAYTDVNKGRDYYINLDNTAGAGNTDECNFGVWTWDASSPGDIYPNMGGPGTLFNINKNTQKTYIKKYDLESLPALP